MELLDPRTRLSLFTLLAYFVQASTAALYVFSVFLSFLA